MNGNNFAHLSHTHQPEILWKLPRNLRDVHVIFARRAGEIARLRERRFRVTLDPTHAAGSRTIHVVCRLEDRRVPAVPPLHVAIPEDYPDTSPTCDTDADEYSECRATWCFSCNETRVVVALRRSLGDSLIHCGRKMDLVFWCAKNTAVFFSIEILRFENQKQTLISAEATEFLEAVQKHLASLILNLPDKYSISTLLNMWVSTVHTRTHTHTLPLRTACCWTSPWMLTGQCEKSERGLHSSEPLQDSEFVSKPPVVTF